VTKKKTQVPEEVSENEFLEMGEVTETGRKSIVDYDALIDKLDGKFLSIQAVGQLMIKCSHGQKTKVYYSEVLGAIKRLADQGRITFERRQGLRVYYHFKKVDVK